MEKEKFENAEKINKEISWLKTIISTIYSLSSIKLTSGWEVNQNGTICEGPAIELDCNKYCLEDSIGYIFRSFLQGDLLQVLELKLSELEREFNKI